MTNSSINKGTCLYWWFFLLIPPRSRRKQRRMVYCVRWVFNIYNWCWHFLERPSRFNLKRRFNDWRRNVVYMDQVREGFRHSPNMKINWLRIDEWTYIKRGVYPHVIYPDIAAEICEAKAKLAAAEKCEACGNYRPLRDTYDAYFPGSKVLRKWWLNS